MTPPALGAQNASDSLEKDSLVYMISMEKVEFSARRTLIHGRDFGCTYADTFPLAHLTSSYAVFLRFQLDQWERPVEPLIKFFGFAL